MAEVKWIKLNVGMFDGYSFKKIKKAKIAGESFRDKLTAVWFELMDFAGKCNAGGKLIESPEIPFSSIEDIAIVIDREPEELTLCMEYYIRNNMITIIDDVYMLTNWAKYQNEEGLEKIREQTRKRVARHRENQKLLANNENCNVTVTLRNAIEEDIEIDKEIELDKDKKKKETYKSVVSRYTQNPLLVSSLNDYIEMRKKIKGFTVRALELGLVKLDKLASDDEEKIAIVNQTIENSWKGFFPLKEEFKRKEIVPDWIDEEEEPQITSDDVKKRALALQLKLGTISQAQYDENIKELDKSINEEFNKLYEELKNGTL